MLLWRKIDIWARKRINQIRSIKFWAWIHANSTQLQTIIAVVGILSFLFAYSSLKLEFQKFHFDYGDQISVVYNESELEVRPLNKLVSNINVKVEAYLQISDKRFSPKNPQYILLENYLSEKDDCSPTGCAPSQFDLSADKTKIPLWSQMENLQILFNQTPTKVYANLLCIVTIDYSDPQRRYQKEKFVLPDCLSKDSGYSDYSDRRLIRVTTEQLNEYLNNELIIGSVDFAKTNQFGLGSYYSTRRILNLLSKYRWHFRYLEPSSIRNYRLYKK